MNPFKKILLLIFFLFCGYLANSQSDLSNEIKIINEKIEVLNSKIEREREELNAITTPSINELYEHEDCTKGVKNAVSVDFDCYKSNLLSSYEKCLCKNEENYSKARVKYTKLENKNNVKRKRIRQEIQKLQQERDFLFQSLTEIDIELALNSSNSKIVSPSEEKKATQLVNEQNNKNNVIYAYGVCYLNLSYEEDRKELGYSGFLSQPVYLGTFIPFTNQDGNINPYSDGGGKLLESKWSLEEKWIPFIKSKYQVEGYYESNPHGSCFTITDYKKEVAQKNAELSLIENKVAIETSKTWHEDYGWHVSNWNEAKVIILKDK